MLENKNPRSDNNIKEDELIFNHYSPFNWDKAVI